MRTHTEEIKAKIRAAALARPNLEEHMAKLTASATAAKKGSKHSEATLAKFKLRKFTDEQRAKISAAAKAREAKAREARNSMVPNKVLGTTEGNLVGVASTRGGNRIGVLVTNIKTSEIIAYPSLSAAGKGIGVSKDTIKKYLESGGLYGETFTFAKQDK